MALEVFSRITDAGYNFRDKLTAHVLERSAAAFDAGDAARHAISTQDELMRHAQSMRRHFEEAMGGIPYDPSLPLNHELRGVIHEPLFDIEKIVFQSRPHVYVTANLYLPHERRSPCGAVLFCAGHGNDGKSDTDYQGVVRAIASAGVIVLFIDPWGQGERLSYYEPSLGLSTQSGCTDDHQYAGHQVMLTGDAPVRYFIADARRAIDYLLTRPEVDPAAIGVTGSSGGGTMTANLMVCEPRIGAAAPGTFLMTRRSYLYAEEPQDAEQIWMGSAGYGFDHADVLACFAPRPCLVLCDDSDFFPIEGTLETVAEGRRLYALCGAEGSLSMTVDHSTHAYTPHLAAEAAAFFARVLNSEERTRDASALIPLPERMMDCTPEGQVRAAYPDARFIFDENRDRTLELSRGLTTAAAKAFVRAKTDAFRKPVPIRLREFPWHYASGTAGRAYFWFTQERMPCHAVLLREVCSMALPRPVKICLFDRGTDDIAVQSAYLNTILREGSAAFVLDVSGIGKCAPNSYREADIHGPFGTLDTISKNLFFLGDSLCALRLFELERALEAVRMIPGLGDISVCARGHSGILAHLLSVLHPKIPIEVQDSQRITDIVLRRYYEEYDLAGFMLPGIAPYAVALGF